MAKSTRFSCVVFKEFSSVKDFGYKYQIQNAVVSISNNIAEGFDRMSDKEFVRFLYISLGSCSEVKSML
ncbi:four helix bundle protein [Flavobacterium sp.]|uniref:four helix bundle protein n=1 Tax=Flavobacterium sp. TaxID=239 RepID=UPI00334227A2